MKKREKWDSKCFKLTLKLKKVKYNQPGLSNVLIDDISGFSFTLSMAEINKRK